MNRMNERQRRFAELYVGGPPGVRGNGTRAAVAAGYAPKGAAVQAHRLLRRPAVRAQLADHLAAARVEAAQVLEQVRAVAFASIGDIVTWETEGLRLRPTTEWPPDAAVGVALARQTQHGTEVRMRDSVRALGLLLKCLSPGQFVSNS